MIRRNKNRISLIQNSKEDSLKIDKIREVPKILYFDELSSQKKRKSMLMISWKNISTRKALL
jgi:hypothetical protein